MFEHWACEENFLLTYLAQLGNADTDRIEKTKAFFEFNEAIEAIPPILMIDGDEATITINGFLAQNGIPPIMRFFGYEGTAYKEIVEAIDTIKENDEIKKVRLLMDTPGGEVDGVDLVWQALNDLGKKKTIVAENLGLVASAGYWIASAAKEISANSPVAETGSIGVVLTQIDYSEAEKRYGIKRVKVISKNAPKKQADGTTKTGLAALQDRVDAIERIFIARIAEGRGIDIKTVEKDFGQGSVLVAQDPEAGKPDALSVGMIDRLDGESVSAKKGADDGDEIEAGKTPPFADLPLVDQTWDADAAIERVKKFTKSTDEPSAGYKRAFFWYDDEAADKFGSYKLPFADVVDGKLSAIRKGIFAANGAMKGARGGTKIPNEDRSKVQGHIDKYLAKIEKLDKQKEDSAAEAVENAKGKDQTMKTLAELIAESPELAAEVEKGNVDAATEAIKKVNAVIDTAIPFLKSDAYPEQIRSLACDVIKGDAEPSALKAAAAVIDSIAASDAAAKAEADSAAAGDTPPDALGASDPKANGTIDTEEDYQAEIARAKTGLGIE